MLPCTDLQYLDDALVAHIAHRLEQDGIWNALWGNYLLSIFGVPTYVKIRQPYSTAQSSL